MSIIARAPGKLVIMGEYAVLTGAQALVIAVNRHCVASIDAAAAASCELTTYTPGPANYRFDPHDRSGVRLVDLVREKYPQANGRNWAASLDSTAFFEGASKLGLGSSAAALCAFAGAWNAFTGTVADAAKGLEIADLIGLHRLLQGGGSGLDVAAAASGGLITYRIGPESEPQIGSVSVPNSVGFASVFAGKSAQTADFVAKFNAWRVQRPLDCAAQMEVMQRISDAGCAALGSSDVSGFLVAVSDYGRELERLGEKIGADIVTAEHRRIAALAARFGVVYKVSGAGGGDVGLAVGTDSIALNDFERAVRAEHLVWVELAVDNAGLTVEERV